LNDIGGIMLWKLNAAFPSVVWQVYDYYLNPNAGYYFMQNSCEPVHVQLNLLDNVVTVINRSYRSLSGLTVEATVLGLDSKLLHQQQAKLTLSASDVKESFSLAEVLNGTKGITFVVLNLKDAAGKGISRNVYWQAADNNYTALQSMPRTQVETIVLKKEQVNDETRWTVKFTNNSKNLAFFINPRLMAGTEEVLPAYWSTNYFTLAPGESITGSVSAAKAQLTGATQQLIVKGWNVEEKIISLK
jgi:hypothetical protein